MRRAAFLLLLASPAHAGRTLFGWLPETDTVPKQGVEIGTSIYEHDNLGPYHERTTALLWTPAVGLTECLELAIPVELVTRTADDSAPWSGIARYGAELRYRFSPRASALRPLARFALSRDVAIQTQVRSEIELAASYDAGPFEVEANTSGIVDINFGHVHKELRPGAGANVPVTDELRVGAEIHSELALDKETTSWVVVGPDVAWTRGRFWLTGVVGIGLWNVTAAPRLNIGMVW